MIGKIKLGTDLITYLSVKQKAAIFIKYKYFLDRGETKNNHKN